MFLNPESLKRGNPALSWGDNITEASDARSTYITALKEVDNEHYKPLKRFMFDNIGL